MRIPTILLLTASSTGLFSCNSNPAAPPTSQPSQTPAKESPAKVETSSIYPTAGIVFGQNVRLRQDSTLNSPEIAKVSTGERLELLQATYTLYAAGNNTLCESCPMVQVKTESGAIGWIHGKFVYRILNKFQATEALETVGFASGSFRLKACRNFGLGADDPENGLTGCWEPTKY